MEFRAPVVRKVRPLRQPEAGMRPSHSSRHRQFVCVGNAVNPNRLRSQPATEPDGEVTGRGTGGYYDVRSDTHQEKRNLERAPKDTSLLLSITVGNHTKAAAVEIASVRGACRRVGNVAAVECWPQPEQLNPMPASGR